MIKREEKKQMIIHAATECFSQLGYDKTTLDDIGGKVKLNKASLYYYYNSKEDLFCDVIYAEAQRFREEIRNKTRALRSAEEKVIFFLTERSRFYKRLKHLQEITMNMMKKIEPIFYTLQQGIQQEEKNMLKEMLDEGIHTGEINRTDPSRLSEVLLKVSSAFKMNGSDTEQSDINTIEDIRFTTRLILRGVKG